MSMRRHLTLLTSFSFFRLRSPDIVWYQWIYPSILFAVGYGGYQVLGEKLIVVDGAKIMEEVSGFMGVLCGFYIAALAAVASFRNDTLDKELSGRPVKLVSVRQGKRQEEVLTRRRFLAILFGYCAFLSVCLYVVGAIERHVVIGEIVEPWLHQVLYNGREIVLALYAWALASLVVATLLGLHYLVDRMHRS